MALYAHIKGGRIVAIQGDAGLAQTHDSVKHLWQKLPEREKPWEEGEAAPEGMADAPHVHPALPVGEFIACWSPQELRDLYAADGLEGADPDIADFSHRLKVHLHTNTGIDRNSTILQNALQRMTEVKVPGAKPARTYLTKDRRDQIMAAVRL